MAEQAKVFPKPVDWDELYPGRFLKASDLKGAKVTVKIADVNLEELIGDKGAQVKGVMKFEGKDKLLALNKTNGICLKEMFGKKVPAWTGKRVTLFAGNWNGDECIRIWGSPDIEAEREITIALPRKRPFAMTMHKTGPAAVKSAVPKEAASGGNTDMALKFERMLRDANSADALATAWETVSAFYDGNEIPLPLDAAHNEMREQFA
jgi:hypothetical protein